MTRVVERRDHERIYRGRPVDDDPCPLCGAPLLIASDGHIALGWPRRACLILSCANSRGMPDDNP